MFSENMWLREKPLEKEKAWKIMTPCETLRYPAVDRIYGPLLPEPLFDTETCGPSSEIWQKQNKTSAPLPYPTVDWVC